MIRKYVLLSRIVSPTSEDLFCQPHLHCDNITRDKYAFLRRNLFLKDFRPFISGNMFLHIKFLFKILMYPVIRLILLPATQQMSIRFQTQMAVMRSCDCCQSCGLVFFSHTSLKNKLGGRHSFPIVLKIWLEI